MMRGFTRGMIVGGLIGASVSMMANSEMLSGRSKNKMMRSGKQFLRKSGHIVGDVVDMFR